MEILDFEPCRLLKPFVRTYKIIESHEEVANRVLPNTSITLAFRFRGQVNYLEGAHKVPLPGAVVTGLRKSVRMINYLGDSATLLVIFKEGGASAFFKVPLHELFEQTVLLDHFLPRQQVEDIGALLSGAADHLERIAIVEQLLLERLMVSESDTAVMTAVQRIQASAGVIRVKGLAAAVYLSQDAFEKRFRKVTGAAPKQFASIVRMNAIIQSRRSGQPLSDLAFDGDYYDQPHFNRYFKLFTGQTPAAFFRAGSFW